MNPDKRRLIGLTGAGICAVIIIVILIFVAGKGKDDSSSAGGYVHSGADSSSQSTLEIITDSPAETVTSAPESSEAVTSAEVTEASSADETSSEAKEYKEYSFRSKKLFDDHFKKHGSEFGSITQEEYLKLANDMLNSDSDTILHKTEKEDGDDTRRR